MFASTGKSIIASKKDVSPAVSKPQSPEPGAEQPSDNIGNLTYRTSSTKLLRQLSKQHCLDAPNRRLSQVTLERDALIDQIRAEAESKNDASRDLNAFNPSFTSAARPSRRRSSLAVFQALAIGTKSAPGTRPASPLRDVRDIHSMPASEGATPCDSGGSSPIRRKVLTRSTQVMQHSIDRLSKNPPKHLQSGAWTDRSWADHLSQLSARSFPSHDVPRALQQLENGEILASLIRQGLILAQENAHTADAPAPHQPHQVSAQHHGGAHPHQKHLAGGGMSGAQTERPAGATRVSKP